MKKTHVFIIFLILVDNLFSQSATNNCENIYIQAERIFSDPKPDYQLAIKKLSAYKLCNPIENKKADALLFKIYETINEQKNDAIEAKKEAVAQKNKVVQRDSLLAQNKLAFDIGTNAALVKEIDPKKALSELNEALCILPDNALLKYLRKDILENDPIYTNTKGSSKFVTSCIARLNEVQFVSGDSEGELKFWHTNNSNCIDKIKIFNSSVNCICVINDTITAICGNDSKDFKTPAYKVKLLNNISKVITTISSENKLSPYTSIASDEKSIYIGNEDSTIYKYEIPTKNFKPLKNIGGKIIGIQCWKGLNKVYYASPFGIYDLGTNNTIYVPKPDSYITYFGFCQSNADIYIGIGEDLILFNLINQKDQLLSPIHKGLITSCKCADSVGNFMTTSTDGYGILWTANGNVDKILKGNKGELYDGYLSSDAHFAVTVGRSRINPSIKSDTNTIKYWHISNFFIKSLEAHQFGATSIVYIDKLKLIITAGNNGFISIWDDGLNLMETKEIDRSGISCLNWDSINKIILYGTFDGKTGYIKLSNDGRKILNYSSINTHNSQVTSITSVNDKIFSSGKDGVLFVQDNLNKRIDSLYFDVELTELSISKNKKTILLAASNKVLLYKIESKLHTIFQHKEKVNSAKWINDYQFATVSGQYLRVWNIRSQISPLIQVDNNIENVMTSLYIDLNNQLIYTGTWFGYIICWDFSGKQLFEFNQLTGMANTNLITSICGSTDNSNFYTVDYTGNISQWYSPLYFLKNLLEIKTECKN